MPLDLKSLEVFSNLYTEKVKKPFVGDDGKNFANFLVDWILREHYQDFENNADQIELEINIIRQNNHALIFHHCTRHLNEHDLQEVFDKVETQTCGTKRDYLICISVIHDLRLLMPIFQELDERQVLEHHPTLSKLYAYIQQSQQLSAKLGITEEITSLKPGLFSSQPEFKSAMTRLIDLFHLEDKNNKPEPR